MAFINGVDLVRESALIPCQYRTGKSRISRLSYPPVDYDIPAAHVEAGNPLLFNVRDRFGLTQTAIRNKQGE